MNKLIITGRLTRDPEIRYSQKSGANGESSAVANFSLAVARKFKRDGEPDVDYFNCVAFGKNAEAAEKFFKQGTKLLIDGHVQIEPYTNKDGQKVSATKVYLETWEFCEAKGTNGEGRPQSAREPVGDGFINIPDDIDEELPFS